MKYPVAVDVSDNATEEIFRIIGLMRFDHLNIATLTLVLSPDIVMLISSVTLFLVIQKSVRGNQQPMRLNQEVPDQKERELGDQFQSLRSKSKPVFMVLRFP